MPENSEIEKQKIIRSIKLPLFFIFLIWIIKVYEVVFNLDFHTLGIFPLKFSSLPCILSSPLIHGSFKHLISNTFPVFILSSGIFYFYRKNAIKIVVLIYLISGLLVWLSARESYHIGASGLVYGFASFLFVGGIVSKDIRLSSVSLLVVFLYGGIIWGILPTKPHISWESHLWGLVVGIVIAFLYKNKQEKPIEYDWNSDDTKDVSYKNIKITYNYKENNDNIE